MNTDQSTQEPQEPVGPPFSPPEIKKMFFPDMQKAILGVPYKMWAKDPDKLYEELSTIDLQLKFRFWDHVKDYGDDGTRVSARKLASGICSFSTFMTKMDSPRFTVWLLQQPPAYEATLDAMHSMYEKRLFEIAELSIKNKKNEVNVQVANLLIKVYTMLDKRKHGEYTQKILQKTQHIPGPDAKDFSQLDSPEDIQERIKLLEHPANEE